MIAILIIIWLLCAMLGFLIGNAKGRGDAGAVLGLLLGIIGVIIIAAMPPASPGDAAPSELKDASGQDLHIERNLPA